MKIWNLTNTDQKSINCTACTTHLENCGKPAIYGYTHSDGAAYWYVCEEHKPKVQQ